MAEKSRLREESGQGGAIKVEKDEVSMDPTLFLGDNIMNYATVTGDVLTRPNR